MNSTHSIVVTGAGGFLGGRLVKHLVALYPEATITATSRRRDRQQEFEQAGIRFMAGDLSEEAFCEVLTQGATAVVHCAALSSPWGKEEAFLAANVGTTQNLLNASLKNGVKRFIFISTPSIYFNYTNRFQIRESDPLPRKMVNHYACTKLIAEKLVLAQNTQGIETVALRPRAIIGAEDTVIFPRLMKAYEEKKLKVIGDGTNTVDLTNVRNVLEAVVCSLQADTSAMGEAYNITNGAPVVLWEEINYLLDQLKLPPLRKKVPAGLVMAIASLMEWKAKIVHPDKEPTLTRFGIGVLAYSITMDISSACEKLGYKPVQTTREGINEFIEWYKNQSN